MTEMTQQAAGIPAQDALRQDVTEYCRTCRKFREAQQSTAALADVDALPASVYFRVLQLLKPAFVEHIRRAHPALHRFNQQAEAARQAALGMQT